MRHWASWAGSFNRERPRRWCWGSDRLRPAPGPLGCWSCGAGEAFDRAIAQRVVDAFDQFPGGGDDADVAAASCRDPVAVGPDAGVRADVLDRFDRGPAD